MRPAALDHHGRSATSRAPGSLGAVRPPLVCSLDLEDHRPPGEPWPERFTDQTHRIRLSLGGPMLKLSVQTPDLGEASEEMAIEYDGAPLDIGFNANYLLELLRYMPTDEVRLSFKAPERAATMEPVGNEDTPDFLCLVMPLRLLD